MEHRHFYVALAVPRGLDANKVEVAYRKLVTRYRGSISPPEYRGLSDDAILSFAVLRTYSERRHTRLMDAPEPSTAEAAGEVDRFFGGTVPAVAEMPRAREADKDLYVEIRMSPQEAAGGGIYPVHVPVIRDCPACTGEREEEARLTCRSCMGRGKVTEDRQIEVTVPPGVVHDQRAEVSMADVGLGHTSLIVHVLVT